MLGKGLGVPEVGAWGNLERFMTVRCWEEAYLLGGRPSPLRRAS